MKSDRATLGGVPGTGYVELYSADGAREESVGLFAFASEDEPKVHELFRQSRLQEFEGPVWDGGQCRRMGIKVVMTGIRFGGRRVALRGAASARNDGRASGPLGRWRSPRGYSGRRPGRDRVPETP